MKSMKRLIGFLLVMSLVFLPLTQGIITRAQDTQGEEDTRIDETSVGGGYAITGQLEGIGYNAKLYDAANGLPTSDANCILGATNGYIWIGGYSGIIRYDGTVFEQLDTSEGMTSARTLFEDKDGRIWVGTNDNGVVVWDNGKRTHITYKEGLPASCIRSFAQDSVGNVYIATTEGVCYADAEFAIHKVDDDRLNSERIIRLEADSAGLIYGQTKSGKVFTVSKGKIFNLYTSQELGLEEITTILPDPNQQGKVYYGTDSNAVYYGDFGYGKDYLKKIEVSPLSETQWICYACKRVWVSSKKITGYLDEENTFHQMEHLPMDASIEMMASDYQGNMWYASSSQGIMKVVANNFTDISGEGHLDTGVVNATCLFEDTLYIGTDEGLFALDSNLQIVQNDLTQRARKSRIRSLYADGTGNLWVCTFDHNLGLVSYSRTGEIRSYTVADGLPSDEIRCIVRNRNNQYLVGTNNGLAIIQNQFVTNTIGTKEGIANPTVLTVAEGEDGEVYLGTDGDGLYIVDKDYSVRQLTRDDGLTSDVIMRIKYDKGRNVYWIVTSNSIEYMKEDIITPITSFPSNNNYDLYYDNNDDIWILSSYGIYSVNGKDLLNDCVTNYSLYTHANGLMCTPNANSYSELDLNGNLYIAGRDGVCRVNINHFFEENVSAKIGIRSITCNNEKIYADADGTYTLPSDSGRIRISPAILDYTMTNPITRVYLEGKESEGISGPSSSLADLEYTGLKYGTYTLHVQILSQNGQRVITEKTFKIVKQPKLFEMLSVRILLAAIMAAVIAFIVWRVMSGTVIRRQYRKVQEAKEEAERANNAKTRFLANMSAQIRNPISTIMGMNEMIMRESSTDVPKQYYMSMMNYSFDIKKATDSLNGLINDLFDISMIESGNMELVMQEYDVQEMLRNVVSMVRMRAEEKDLPFNIEIDSKIPRRLYGDEGKLKHVLLNLLTNAIKYTEEGSFTLCVSIEEISNKNVTLRFGVKDTGVGIKQEDIGRIFNAYENLETAHASGRRIHGSGLGLDITRRFVELMGGTIWCESVYGEGSQFYFTLKQKIVEAEAIGTFAEQKEPMVHGPYMPLFIAPDAEVLVVDDNPMNLAVIKGMLKSTRIFVSVAKSGSECLEKIKYGSFNVVLLDQMMPEMDGVETVAKIRELYPDLPVYAMSANTLVGEDYYIEKGFTGYLVKPIDSAELEHAIMNVLPENIMKKPTQDDMIADATELPEALQWVNEVDTINVLKGIKAAGGVNSYVFSLETFYETIDELSGLMDYAYETEDMNTYLMKVHILKTSARFIGASHLTHLAEDMENAGKRRNMNYVRRHHGELMREYRALKEKLSQIDASNS